MTPPEDFDRFAESLLNFGGKNIVDVSSYNSTFDLYMEGEDLTFKQNTVLRKQGFDAVRRIKPSVSTQDLFSRAKGTDLKRDRKKDATVITTSVQEYISRGARRSDFKGLDTVPIITCRIKGRRVLARVETVKIRGKPQTRYRDKKGRFATRYRDKKGRFATRYRDKKGRFAKRIK